MLGQVIGQYVHGYESLNMPKQIRQRSKIPFWILAILTATVLIRCFTPTIGSFEILSSSKNGPQNQPTKVFSWSSDIIPSRHLNYTPCFGRFQCARLEEPLNWNSTDPNGPTAAIAVIRLPARVSITDERYGGAIILNPGGPGESGIHQVLKDGVFTQVIIDAPSSHVKIPDSNTVNNTSQEKYFDIISFDPRGVNNTTPRLKCHPTAYDQQNWLLKLPDYGILWDSEAVLGLEWARAEAQGKACSQGDGKTDMIRFVNSAQTVEDMVALIEAHGEWRAAEAERLISTQQALTADTKSSILQRTTWNKGQEKLQYWGTSYGTLLGVTFASMHPSLVSRMILDGNLQAEDYYSGQRLKNLQNSDAIITAFCTYCFQSGPTICPIFSPSPALIEARLTNIMLNLRFNPLAVVRADGAPEAVLYGDMHLFGLLTAMYFPATAEHFFRLLAEAESGDGSWLAELKQAWFKPMVVSKDCVKAGPFSEECIGGGDYIAGFGPEQSIACMDQGGRSNITKVKFWEYWDEVSGQSRWISRSWARGRIACVGYEVEPAWAYEGPYTGKTAHPLLIIGNTHDTVTPLENAYHNAASFPGSVVLQQDSQGHCAYSMPSLCTALHVREYFQTGTVPPVGTVCVPEYKPFIGCLRKELDVNGEERCREMSGEEAEVWEAQMGLAGGWPV